MEKYVFEEYRDRMAVGRMEFYDDKYINDVDGIHDHGYKIEEAGEEWRPVYDRGRMAAK